MAYGTPITADSFVANTGTDGKVWLVPKTAKGNNAGCETLMSRETALGLIRVLTYALEN